MGSRILVERTKGVIVEGVVANLRGSRYLENVSSEVAPSDTRSPTIYTLIVNDYFSIITVFLLLRIYYIIYRDLRRTFKK